MIDVSFNDLENFTIIVWNVVDKMRLVLLLPKSVTSNDQRKLRVSVQILQNNNNK